MNIKTSERCGIAKKQSGTLIFTSSFYQNEML